MNTMTKPAPVNGIPVADVLALVAQVTENPAAGMTHWRVTNSWRGGTQSRAHVNGFIAASEQHTRVRDDRYVYA